MLQGFWTNNHMSKRYKAKRRARYYRERGIEFEIENPPCWCGVENPYYAPVHENCGGMGIIDCHCGGDLCVCHNHGEVECLGCEDCQPDDNDDGYCDCDEQYDQFYEH